MSTPHIADAESQFIVVNITPDFCKVDGKTVPFDISRDLTHEDENYASSVHARGAKVLKLGSVVHGVVGNMGQGVRSAVSLDHGDVVTVTGSRTFHVEGRPVVRHWDLARMNVK